MSRYTWNIVHDCDADDGAPTCWATKLETGDFAWISQMADDSFDIEMACELRPGTFTTVMTCRSLASAKSWVSRNL